MNLLYFVGNLLVELVQIVKVNSKARRFAGIFLSLLFLCVIWCFFGGWLTAGTGRYRLSGTIEYLGRSVPQGTISFGLAGEGQSSAGFAEIVDGKFDTALGGKGHVGGKHLVTVNAFERPADGIVDEEVSVSALFAPAEWEEEFPHGDFVLKIELPR